jgi:hypothetical protein
MLLEVAAEEQRPPQEHQDIMEVLEEDNSIIRQRTGVRLLWELQAKEIMAADV